MSKQVLFSAPTQTLSINGVELTADQIADVEQSMSRIESVFYPTSKMPVRWWMDSVYETNAAVGNCLAPIRPKTSVADRLAVLAKQLPIIFSEMHEMVTGIKKWSSKDRIRSPEVDADIVEEYINGVADTIYTILGLTARLDRRYVPCDWGYNFAIVLFKALGSHEHAIMNGVCSEQESKFIPEYDIPEAEALFAARGVKIDIEPTPKEGVFVIKSAIDQAVDGEHYPKGKWLKGPNFVRYKLPNDIISSMLSPESRDGLVDVMDEIIDRLDMVTPTLKRVPNKLNTVIESSFGADWKMNLTKRDEMLDMVVTLIGLLRQATENSDAQ